MMMTDSNREVWNGVAPGWYHRRHWSRFGAELTGLAARWRGGRVLNLGCAHGADFIPFAGKFELHGADISRIMLQNGQEYAAKHRLTAELTLADAAALPFREASFDGAVAVAVYHHLRGAAARSRGFAELYRVLRPGAEAFLTVWNRRQRRFGWYRREAVVPWRRDGRTLGRYHYLYSYRELKQALVSAGLEVIRLGPEQGYRGVWRGFSKNICALVRRPDTGAEAT